MSVKLFINIKIREMLISRLRLDNLISSDMCMDTNFCYRTLSEFLKRRLAFTLNYMNSIYCLFNFFRCHVLIARPFNWLQSLKRFFKNNFNNLDPICLKCCVFINLG